MTLATLFLAGAAALMIVGYLIKRPALNTAAKVWLFFAIGVLPLGAAFTGNVAGFEATTQRKFCGSCHEMTEHARDAADPAGTGLAAFHSRNQHFGEQSCYNCHRDYGMYGTVTTKIGAMRHVWAHFVTHPTGPLALYKPFPNASCTQCHSMTLPGWKDEPEHGAVLEDLATGKVSCATKGCHGPAHPTTKKEKGS